MVRIIKKNKLTWLILLLIIVSCNENQVFDEYQSVSDKKWNDKNPISFQFDVTDSLSKRNLFINLRNNNKYAFSNLYLITKMIFPDGKKVIDTLEYEMADKTGKFLGSGFTEIKENKLFYKENIIFPRKGTYKVFIYQSMRKNGEINGIENLEGITELGFRIEKTN